MSSLPVAEALLRDDHLVAALLVENGVITGANAAARALLGPFAAPGAAITALADAGSAHKIALALGAPVPSAIELQLRQSGGLPLPARLLVIPSAAGSLLVVTETGKRYPAQAARQLIETTDHLVDVLRELAQHRAELAATRDHLERLGALRDQFIAALSHDIRSPLSAVAISAATLLERRRTIAPEELERRAAQIIRNVRRVVEMIDQVLLAAQLDSETLEIARAPVSVRDVAVEVADALEAVAAHAGVAIVVAAPEPAWVIGDRLRLFQVIENLVANAVRHAPRDSEVALMVEVRGGRVRCSVRDRGPGVSPELRAKIFERFTAGGRPGASGLGLYIARQIVELHGGTIGVEDAEGGGACFVFDLPVLARAEAADDP